MNYTSVIPTIEFFLPSLNRLVDYEPLLICKISHERIRKLIMIILGIFSEAVPDRSLPLAEPNQTTPWNFGQNDLVIHD